VRYPPYDAFVLVLNASNFERYFKSSPSDQPLSLLSLTSKIASGAYAQHRERNRCNQALTTCLRLFS
jgi:hypothetical protein